MATNKAPIHATLTTVLIYYDGPQLIHLKSIVGNNMVAVAVDHKDSANMYFGCEVRDKDFARYLDGKVDLKYLLSNAMRNRYYLFDGDKLSDDGSFIEIKPLKSGEEKQESYWPKAGLFSRSHTQNPKLETEAKGVVGQQSYNIDGKWEATDFSRFYGKMADLYALFAIFDETWDSLSSAAKSKIEQIINSKMFQGGGSYVGFYDQIYAEFARTVIAPLRLSKISYASPGQVVFDGDLRALRDIVGAIDKNEDHNKDLARKYNFIRGVLKQQKLLGRGPQSSFSSDELRQKVKHEADALAKSMGIENTFAIYEVSGKNTLIYAKIVLSIFRRLDELTEFQAEGRIAFERLDLETSTQ
jgi:hypothetical protein